MTETVELDFAVRELRRPDDAWFAKTKDWGEISELMEGDVRFVVNGTDFGVKNNFIVAMVDTLLIALDRLVFYEDRIRISYPEHFENLRLEKQGKSVKLTSMHGREVLQETTTDFFLLSKAVGAFSKRVTRKLFEEYPLPIHNVAFFYGFPHGSLRWYYYSLEKNPTLQRYFYE